ncbi:uncharacterized protein LOC125651877 [Ostrea edulis]|uniref:uncharacterized protein LOC125651877 n=1 Tax=Ostrea edulis TaxID=37623 RepID=UPI0024AFD62F|nr:uncharacterized protein LOC125651877 [Ostrea edulis]XP_048736664.2 uncharacterized protein LOC125651877 [Ostrea edulis]
MFTLYQQIILLWFCAEVLSQGLPKYSQRMDLIFLMDSSGSVGGNNFKKMKQFVKRLLNPVDIDFGDVQVGLLSFSTRPTIKFQLNTYKTKQDIFSAIDGVPWRFGYTNTADALQEMHETMFSRENGDRRDAGNVCIILTDGVSNINYRRTIPEANTAKEKGIRIISIGIGLPDLKEIRGIASEPYELYVFHAETFAELLYLRIELPMDYRVPGILYNGFVDKTETGKLCQRWDSQTPHHHPYGSHPLGEENYCRNFDNDKPWCFTDDRNTTWEYCTVNMFNVYCRTLGVPYRGFRNRTVSGKACQRWDSQSPHQHEYGVYSLADENYCRNFDGDRPWCLTNDDNTTWEYCDVLSCSSELYDLGRLRSKFPYTISPQGNCMYGLSHKCRYLKGLVSAMMSAPDLFNKNSPDEDTLERAISLQLDANIYAECVSPVTYLEQRNKDQECYAMFITDIVKSNNESQFCRSVTRFINCKMSFVMTTQNVTFLVKDKIHVIARLLGELEYIAVKTYPCDVEDMILTTNEQWDGGAGPESYHVTAEHVTEAYLLDCHVAGMAYIGTQNVTVSGYPCQRWRDQYPHRHLYGTLYTADHNYCRTFDNGRPWCFTVNRNVPWEYCNVLMCDNVCFNETKLLAVSQENNETCRIEEEPVCRSLQTYLHCLKDNIEMLYDVTCPDSPVLHRNMLAVLLDSKNISMETFLGCFPSPYSNIKSLTTKSKGVTRFSDQSAYCKWVINNINKEISELSKIHKTVWDWREKIVIARNLQKELEANDGDLTIEHCVLSIFDTKSKAKLYNRHQKVSSEDWYILLIGFISATNVLLGFTIIYNVVDVIKTKNKWERRLQIMAQWISLKKRKQSEFYCEIEEVIDSSDDMDDAPYEHPLQQETVTSDYSVLRHTISVDVMSEMSLGLRSLFGEKNGEGSDEQINMEKL